jgi:hypothetical protein
VSRTVELGTPIAMRIELGWETRPGESDEAVR